MIWSFIITSLILFSKPLVIFDFSPDADLLSWQIVDDGVMGGRSDGKFHVDDEGHGVFEGTVSLENNGGFSSLRYTTGGLEVDNKKFLSLRLKGDGKNYQVRIKGSKFDYYSYIYTISTSGEWQTIEVPLIEMYASFRGRRLNMPNFSNDNIAEFTILIGNKKAEDFRLLIDSIILK